MVSKYNGLTEEEALKSRRENGCNVLTVKKNASFFKKLIANFTDPIIKILLFALFITVLLPGEEGSVFETIGIAATILISTLVSTLSEHGSERAFQKMQEEARVQKCTVLRSGYHTVIPIDDVVVGDCVHLFTGERIPADGYIIDGSVQCDQSALTGEGREIEKNAAASPIVQSEFNDSHSVFRGSVITSGEGVMTVTSVGDRTYYGNMAHEVQADSGKSPLKEKLSVLAGTLSKFGYFCAFCVATVYLINSFFLSGDFSFSFTSILTEVIKALTLAVSVVVVAVPEGLPMMITVVLSSNMLRMQKEHIHVRKPVGIETAGGINVLFTDKTGTLTYGTPTAAAYVTGDLSRSGRSSDLSKSIRFLLGTAAVHTADCIIENPLSPDKRRIIGGNSTDRAVLCGYFSSGEYPKGPTLMAKLNFDSRIKLAAATVDLSGVPDRLHKTQMTFIKGAPELLLDRCTGYYAPDGTVKKINKTALLSELDAIASKGARVIAVASSEANADTVSSLSASLKEKNSAELTQLFKNVNFICFVVIKDELRREAPKSVKSLKNAGVQVVMITGDSITTATSIAKEAGILTSNDDGIILESAQLGGMSDGEIAAILPRLRVVARALPSDKSRLVKIAKSMGLVTGMTGDGINDAPALRLADVGFAMGSGTEVAKEAGDIIITDNDISSIVKAVLYGRTIFRSIRKFIIFQLTMNLSAVGISIIGPLIRFDTPVTVIQMLWINIIIDTLAALAFAGESPRAYYMKSPPVSKSEPVLNGDMITKIFVIGIYTVMLCLFFHQSAYVRQIFGRSDSSAPFLCGFFSLFVFSGTFGAFSARASRLNILSGLSENHTFLVVISLVISVQLALIYNGASLFRCTPLSFLQLRTVFLLALTVIPANLVLELLMKIGKKTPSLTQSYGTKIATGSALK